MILQFFSEYVPYKFMRVAIPMFYKRLCYTVDDKPLWEILYKFVQLSITKFCSVSSMFMLVELRINR